MALAALLLARGGPAGAQEPAPAAPRIVLEVSGACPPRQAVRASLEPRLQVVEAGPAWRLEVQRTGGSARMVLHDPSGRQALERSIESDDCPALGQAIAFIVDAQLVQLRLLPARIEAAPGWAESRPAPLQPLPSPTAPRGPGQLTLGLGGGLGLGLAGSPGTAQVGGAGQLDVAYSPPGRAFLLRLAVQASGPLKQARGADQFTLVPVILRLEGGLRRGTGRLYGQLTGLVGLGLVRSSTSIDDTTGTDTNLVLGASAVGGVRLTPTWSLRLEAAPQFFVKELQRGRFFAPDSALSTDPRVLLQLLLALEAALPL